MGQSRRSSVFQLVSFVIVEQQYALPLSVVERVLPMVAMSPLPQAPPIALGVINLHGQVIPVLDIRRRLGFPAHGYGLTAAMLLDRILPDRSDWALTILASEAPFVAARGLCDLVRCRAGGTR